MMAHWVENDNVWLNQSLIASCIATEKNLGNDLQLYNPETSHEGDFYVGLDPAQTKDYPVLSVVESVGEKLLHRL